MAISQIHKVLIFQRETTDSSCVLNQNSTKMPQRVTQQKTEEEYHSKTLLLLEYRPKANFFKQQVFDREQEIIFFKYVMRTNLLKRCQQDRPRGKFLCFGDYRIGKSNFLKQFSNSTQPDFDDGSHFCKVFVKLCSPPCINQKIGIELYQLPSTSNPIYNSCYMENDYDGIIYFFEMTNSNICSELVEFLRTYSEINRVDVWRVPVLLVGLKKQNICYEKFEQYKGRVLGKFMNIIPASSIVFFGGEPLDNQSTRQLQHLTRFVETITFTKTLLLTSLPTQYNIIQSLQSYRMLHTTKQLLSMCINTVACKFWSYLKQYKFFLNL